MSTVIDNGLIVDNATTPPTAVGYIFNFEGKGAYAPDGLVKVGDTNLTQAQVDEHNKLLGEMEMEHAKQTGKGLFISRTKLPLHPAAIHARGDYIVIGECRIGVDRGKRIGVMLRARLLRGLIAARGGMCISKDRTA